MRKFGVHESLGILAALIFLAVAAPAAVEIVPLFFIKNTVERVSGMRPLTPLESFGHSIYIRENCQSCHSRMVRTLPQDVDRYGHYSLAAESLYEHPAQWGDKRAATDLARLGGRYTDVRLVEYLQNPHISASGDKMPGYMPSYAYLSERVILPEVMAAMARRLRAQRRIGGRIGVPYDDAMIDFAAADLRAQAGVGSAEALWRRYGDNVKVRDFGGDGARVTEMDALVAYLQVLGELVDFADYGERR